MERITNPNSRSWQLGFRRFVYLKHQPGQPLIKWYIKKGKRATIVKTLRKHNLLY